MSYRRRSRYSSSPSPYKHHGRSVSRSLSRSRSRSRSSSDAANPVNNLYVTGLSTHVTKRDLEKHFSSEGKVEDVHLVIDPWTRESRGFGFITVSTLKEAERCVKYLDGSVLEGRIVTVEKARRRRGRTPTPGRYLGLKSAHVRRCRSPSVSPYSGRRSCSYSSHSRSQSPQYSPQRERSRSRTYSLHCRRRRSYSAHSQRRSYSPDYGWRRQRSYSPDYNRRSSYSPNYSHRRSYSRGRSSPDYNRRSSYSPDYSHRRSYSRSRSPSYSRSPVSRRYRVRSPYLSRSRGYRRHYRSSWDYSRDDRGCGKRGYSRSRYQSPSPSVSPRHWRHSRRSYSRSASPISSSSMSPSYSRSVSPSPKKSLKRSFRHDSYDRQSSRSHSRSPFVLGHLVNKPTFS